MRVMSISNMLGVFKEKIEDAVSMVPDMIAEEKLRAVQFWNVVSERLQEIVNNSAADITALAFQLEKDKFPEYLDGSLTGLGVSSGIVSGFNTCGGMASQLITGGGGTFVSPALMKKYIGGEARSALIPTPMLGLQRSRTRGCRTSFTASGPLTSGHSSAILLSTPASCTSPSLSIDSPFSVGMGLIVKGVGEDENRGGNGLGINSVVEFAIGEGKECNSEVSTKEKNGQQLLNHVSDASTMQSDQVAEQSRGPDGSMVHLMIAADPIESASNDSSISNSTSFMMTDSEPSSDRSLAQKEIKINSDRNIQPSDGNAEALGKNDNKQYNCHDCKSSFSSKGNLIVHIRRHTGEKPYVCVNCESRFSTKGNLKRHVKAHMGIKPWECTTCGGRFTEKKSLKVHMRRHTGEKPYQCKVCSKKFSQSGILQSHMAMHLNQKAHLCELCGKSFRQKSQLRLHTQRHQGVRKFDCPHCPAKFLTKGDMMRHKRTHTGERPFECSLCGKTFTRQQSLNEHKNRHYGYKPYKCKYCSKGFAEMSACYKHIKSHEQSCLQGSEKTGEHADDDPDDPPGDESEKVNRKEKGMEGLNQDNDMPLSKSNRFSKENCASK
ncbi:uncharacterized protein [Hetaerina americana]|uniref:uncharacterized protein n=1 Tax=Hetaerina americana TaxID=62018 RepID=UPI003A7F322D